MDTLALSYTEELTTELNKRFDALIVIGVQMKTGKVQDTFYHRYMGGYSHCLGLVEIMKSILLKDYHKDDDSNTPEI